jgi:hypothetical protein
MVYLVALLVVVVAGESWLLWRVAVALGVLERYEERLAHLTGALHLLTDTAESGFASFAGALTEAAQPVAKPKTARRRRAVPAARPSAVPAAITRSAAEADVPLGLQMVGLEQSRYSEWEA